MIDCGEGTQMQLTAYGKKHSNISHICISHLHGDHYLGLMGLLSSMSLSGRKDDLILIGPPALKQILDIQIKHGGMHLNFKMIFLPTNPNSQELITQTPFFEIISFPLKHRIHCTGFLIREINKEKHLNIKVVEQYQIPIEQYKFIKKGKDYIDDKGQIIENSKLTFPAEKNNSYAYCSDTIFDTELVQYVQNVDLLYHEATYLTEHIDRAELYYHSTALQAATIALQANVKKLIIGHFSSRYDNLNALLEEAKTVFENTDLALEGHAFMI